MADRLAIYQGALRLLGSQRIASLVEVHPARIALDDVWQSAGDYLLKEGLWNWGMRTVELEADDNITPLFGYQYAFSKPADTIRTASLAQDATFNAQPLDFADENGYWFTDVDPVYARYVSSDAQYGWDVGKWPETFAGAMSAYMAFECGLPISNDRGNRNDLYTLYEARLKKSKILDAADESVKFTAPGRLVRSRFNRSTSRQR